MKIKVWISTNKVGSECEDEVYIPDDELEGLDKAARDAVIEEYARDAAFNFIEGSWTEEASDEGKV